MRTASFSFAHPEAAQTYIQSADGTRLHVTSIGNGPPVIFVHGSLSIGTDWMCIARRLCHRHTCIMLDRRNHGGSDTGSSPYCIEREYDDIAAVLRWAGQNEREGPSLVGHSFGAICALGAALRCHPRRLVLYEPPLPVAGAIAGEYLEPFQKAVAEKRLNHALSLGMEHYVNMPPAQVQKLRASSAWPRMVALAHTWPAELAAMDALNPDLSEFNAISCPAMLVLGGRSATHPFREATLALARTLPDARLALLPGHGHLGIGSARILLSRQIEHFLS